MWGAIATQQGVEYMEYPSNFQKGLHGRAKAAEARVAELGAERAKLRDEALEARSRLQDAISTLTHLLNDPAVDRDELRRLLERLGRK